MLSRREVRLKTIANKIRRVTRVMKNILFFICTIRMTTSIRPGNKLKKPTDIHRAIQVIPDQKPMVSRLIRLKEYPIENRQNKAMPMEAMVSFKSYSSLMAVEKCP